MQMEIIEKKVENKNTTKEDKNETPKRGKYTLHPMKAKINFSKTK